MWQTLEENFHLLVKQPVIKLFKIEEVTEHQCSMNLKRLCNDMYVFFQT